MKRNYPESLMRNKKLRAPLRRNRRGITLLFVISMIVLFLLMGTTFVIVSNNFFRDSRKRSIREVHQTDAKALLERGFYDLVRGPDPNNMNSPLRTHEILADQYGYTGFKGTVTAAVSSMIPETLSFATPINSDDHLVDIQISTTGATAPTNIFTGGAHTLSNIEGEYNGQVFSFLDGQLAGTSTRIHDYRIVFSGGVPTEWHFMVVAPRSRPGADWSALIGNEILVNGRDFAGTGAGTLTAGTTEGVAALGENAMQPNRVGETLAVIDAGYLGGTAQPNESYDFPDDQNMFLSGFDSTGAVLPSFYRDWSTRYFGTRQPFIGAAPQRHMFTAFNVLPEPIDSTVGATGPPVWTVDTDNDGQSDALWMDIGLSVQSAGNGIYYKPLYAFRVVDLDSCINLNTAGNRPDMIRVVNGTPSPTLPGLGFGPADVSLETFLTAGDYENIIEGDNGTILLPSGNLPGPMPGRYGLGADGIADSGDEFPGAAAQDTWSTKKLFGMPQGTATVGRHFQTSPLDIRGRFSISVPDNATTGPSFVEAYTDPNFAFNISLPSIDVSPALAVPLNDSSFNNPYEASFSVNVGLQETGDDDTPFIASELERVFRPNDIDSEMLDLRLSTFLQATLTADFTKRQMVTTDSFEVPVCSNWFIGAASRTATPLTALDVDLRNLLPIDVWRGRKMNLNRPFGNGLDDNGDLVIDDPQETGQVNSQDLRDPTRVMDLNNDFQIGAANDQLARHRYATRLYILMLAVCETTHDNMTDEQYRTAMAQWAINVVDFMDPDSINTGFEFDINPFNGWATADIDGIISPGETGTGASGERRVVWGCERPELLITEAAAYHDRATQDLASDASGVDVAGGDLDWDSRLIPRTSAFIELYHPWTQGNAQQILPHELGRLNASNVPVTPVTGVDLQRRTPGNNNPVWRIGVRVGPRDPTTATPPGAPLPDTGGTFVRSIYFTDLASTASGVTGGGEEFFTTFTLPVVTPGSHVVIGSAGTSTTGTAPNTGFRTTFGRLQTATDASLMLDDTRSITLIPNANQIVRNEWDTTAMAMANTTLSGVPVVIDGPRSLSLSDPDGGYVTINPTTNLGDGVAFVVPEDVPLDADPSRTLGDLEAIWTNGTTDNFRYLELQRLANPNLDWDVQSNPYITIDTAPVDLTSFNGMFLNQENDTTSSAGSTVNTDFEIDTTVGGYDPAFVRAGGSVIDGNTVPDSTERGETTTSNLLFAEEPGSAATADGTVIAADGHNFSFTITESFGGTNSNYRANPGNRYAWLIWNNRPFMNHYELANVPYTKQRRLTERFGIRNLARDPFTVQGTPVASAPQDALAHGFGHLLNFEGDQAATQAVDASQDQGGFYRLFDFVEVPSQYVGTESWANPADFFNAPFNSFSSFRYPGKVNFNTARAMVYNQTMGQYNASLGFGGATGFDASRWQQVTVRDPLAPPPTPPALPPTINIQMPRPFRNYAEGSFVPALTTNGTDINALAEENIDCGFLRRTGTNDTPGITGLFDYGGTGINRNGNRNSFFRNSMRQRIGNIATTRSSVFAIWITVGFFETDSNGNLLNVAGGGNELGADTGDSRRHRGFFIYDRSIPTAFEPGQNHNVDDGILVKSIIE